LEGLDPRVFTLTFAAPGTDHPGKWIEILMEILRNSECHLFLILLWIEVTGHPTGTPDYEGNSKGEYTSD
jgi:hypothetical protein